MNRALVTDIELLASETLWGLNEVHIPTTMSGLSGLRARVLL